MQWQEEQVGLGEGDEIKIELEKVGTLSNKVVKEPDSTKFIA